MKSIWKEELNKFEDKHRRKVGKGDFTEIFGTAYLRAFTTQTVESAFRVTGIYPYDRTVIKPTQMKPSKATSTKGAFPLPQPSPVRAVMVAFHHYALARSDLEEGAAAAGPSRCTSQPTTPL